jgi:peptide/nickel transport system substrate-binding protein
VVWRGINEDAARVAALVRGEIDVALSVPTDLVPQVNSSANAEIRAVAAQRAYWMHFVNNNPDLPTSKKEVRQAINYAIDREELNRELFDGKALLMATAVHPLSLGYNPDVKWTYDPAKAKQLLAQAGYPNGFTVGLHGVDGRYARDRELAHAIAGQLARVGINVQVKTMEVGQWTDGIFKKTTDPLALMAFGDADRDRTTNFNTSHRSGSLWSIIAYPELDALISKTEAALDDAQRAQVMREVQDWMMENAPGAYLMTLIDTYGVNKALKWQPRPDDVLIWRDAIFTR